MDESELKIGRPRVKKSLDGGLKRYIRVFTSNFDIFSIVKGRVVSRLYWGRSNAYKFISHFIVLFLTVIIIISGVINNITYEQSKVFNLGSNPYLQNDLLHQGTSINSVIARDPNAGSVTSVKYTVKEGDTLESIAKEYNLRPDTIRWASRDVMNPFTNKIEVGWRLTIPELDGVLYKVKDNQTLEDIIKETSVTNAESNFFNIVEFNGLKPPYNVSGFEYIFIPEGNLIPTNEESLPDIPRGILTNPLSNPSCNGYIISRGFLPYHNGVDMALYQGCPIRSVANGVVEYAGWGNAGQGYYVKINHGGGIKTEYFHGNGEIWVKAGDSVSQDQEIMMMGSTGNSTGPHVHFILWKDGIAVDPLPFVPYEPIY